MAIVSFADNRTEEFFLKGKVHTRAAWKSISQIARRKLDMLEYAHRLLDLRSPPGNHLEALQGDKAGLHCIRINDQWRIIFRWTETGPADVAICDYH